MFFPAPILHRINKIHVMNDICEKLHNFQTVHHTINSNFSVFLTDACSSIPRFLGFGCGPSETEFFLQIVQEYERAVIFRLGRLRKGGARGPGIFFVLPCIDTYCKVDLRTVSFDVPPQEVSTCFND